VEPGGLSPGVPQGPHFCANVIHDLLALISSDNRQRCIHTLFAAQLDGLLKLDQLLARKRDNTFDPIPFKDS